MKHTTEKITGYLTTPRSEREGWALAVSWYYPEVRKKRHYVSQVNIAHLDTVGDWSFRVETLMRIGDNMKESRTNKHVDTINDIFMTCFPGAVPANYAPSALEKTYKFWNGLLDEYIHDLTEYYTDMGFAEADGRK